MHDPELEKIPHHLAIIMDGNGRWARRRGMPRIMGHRQGVKAVRETVTACRELGIKVLTLYAFSKENWNRPKDEVSALMDLLYDYLERELNEMLKNGIRLMAIGEIECLPQKVQDKLAAVMKSTSSNQDMILNLALSYGGRAEIAFAVRKIAQMCMEGKIKPEDIDEDLVAKNLYTAELPDPDLIIRTSGEMRLSNFLLFQAAYSELYITNTLWPDFDKQELIKALQDYGRRERRFGRIGESFAKACTAIVS